MDKFTKEFEYKGHKFITSVELNAVESKITGNKSLHKVTTKDMAGNFYLRSIVYGDSLEESILRHEKEAKKSVYLKGDKNKLEEILLCKLGFKINT